MRLAACLISLCLLTAARQSSSDWDTLVAQATAARTSDHLPEATALYRKALAQRPDWPEGWWWLGTLEYDQNAYSEAAAAFEKLAALDSKAGSARVMLGLCEFELHADDKALKHIQEGEKIGVADDESLRRVALFHEAILLQRAQRFVQSETVLHSLCSVEPDSAELLNTLGMVALRLTSAQNSETFERIGRAECLASEKKYDEAQAAYSAIVKDNPTLPNIHYAFGRFLLEARRNDAGIAELEKEIVLHPNNSLARLEIAAAKYKLDSAAGLPYAEQAVKLDPNRPFGHYLYGLLLLDTDDYVRAIPELETARRHMPEVPAVYSALGIAYSRAGRTADAQHARTEFQRLSKLTPTSEALQP